MKLAICDDDEREINALREQLADYQRSHANDTIVYKTYVNQQLLLREWDAEHFDAAILDIMMPGMSGIELGKTIKEKWPDSVVVFLTSSNEFALDAYGIHAERYIMKPIRQDTLFEALDYIYRTKNRAVRTYAVKTSKGTIVLRQDQIMFVEMDSRKMNIHTVDEQQITSIYLRGTFYGSVEELLDSRKFVITHKSFVVNMEYIKSYSTSSVLLKSPVSKKEYTVPISRHNALDVRQNYLQFMARGREDDT